MKVNKINSFDELNLTIQQYLDKNKEVQILTIFMNQELDYIKTKYHTKIKTVNDSITTLETLIFNYISKNKSALFSKKRCLELNKATIGFRKSSVIIIPKHKEVDIIKKLKDLGREECIRQQETISKSALSSWNCKDLKKIGITRLSKDIPYITENK